MGALSFDKLEAMTAVCSVGLDMIAIPGDTPASTVSAIIADEAAIGMINRKTTAVRLIPAPGKSVGDSVEFGGLLGRAPVMPVNGHDNAAFIARGVVAALHGHPRVTKLVEREQDYEAQPAQHAFDQVVQIHYAGEANSGEPTRRANARSKRAGFQDLVPFGAPDLERSAFAAFQLAKQVW